MRLTTITLLALIAFTVLPVNAAGVDQCVTNANARIVCQTLAVTSPDPRVPVPSTAVYVYVAGDECSANPMATSCRGVVYQESNGCAGLQRKASTACGGKPADTKLVA